MALPQNSSPIYTLEVPSTKAKLKYRAFLVKDEKALMIAQQSEEPSVMIDTLKDIIKSCVKDPIDVDKLASFDLEYIFLQLRSVSVGELVDVLMKCDTCEDEKAVMKVTLNLKDIKVNIPEKHNKKIPLFDSVGVVMKYPTFDLIKRLEGMGEDIESVFNVIVECIDYIYDADQIYPAKDETQEELHSFLYNLTTDQFTKVQEFFASIPKMTKNIKYNCPVCGKAHDKTLEGLSSFF